MCNKAVDAYPSVIKFVLDWYKTQEMRGKVVSKNPFILKYYLDRYKTQKMCADAFLTILKFVPDWSVPGKKIKKLDDHLFFNDDIIFVNEDSNYVKFLMVKWVFLV